MALPDTQDPGTGEVYTDPGVDHEQLARNKRRQDIIQGYILPGYRDILGRDPDEAETEEGYQDYEAHGGDVFRQRLSARAASKGGSPDPAPAPPTNPYEGGGRTSGAGGGAFDDLLRQLMENNSAYMKWAMEDREKQRAWSENIRSQIMTELGKAQQPVTESDPLIARQRQQSSFINQRALQQSREAMAARAAAGGGPTSGASDAAVQSGQENLGIAENSLLTKLIADEMERRRASVMSLLGTGAGVLTADESNAVTRELGTMGNTIGTLRSKVGNLNANRQMDISEMLGLGSLSNQWMDLNNRNSQFYDQLGYNMSHDMALLNYLYSQLAGR